MDDTMVEIKAELDAARRLVEQAESGAKRRIEEAEIEVYKRDKVVGLPNGRQLLGEMTEVRDRKVVDEMVEKRGVSEVGDSELRSMREKLFRGKTGEGIRLEEEERPREHKEETSHNPNLGDMQSWRALAGISK